jgi:hypothetical protein
MAFPESRPGGNGFGSTALDAPPPSPVNPDFSQLMNPTASQPTGPGGQPSSRQLPPDVLVGLLKAGETISSMMDDMAQMVPDIAPDIAGSKDLFQRALGKLVLAGGGNTGPASAPTSRFAGSAPFPAAPGQ